MPQSISICYNLSSIWRNWVASLSLLWMSILKLTKKRYPRILSKGWTNGKRSKLENINTMTIQHQIQSQREARNLQGSHRIKEDPMSKSATISRHSQWWLILRVNKKSADFNLRLSIRMSSFTQAAIGLFPAFRAISLAITKIETVLESAWIDDKTLFN